VGQSFVFVAREGIDMRTLAIGDIHGCLTALDCLLAFVKPLPGDRIITLGDYIDRGPNSKGVLDRLIELSQSGQYGELFPLRGNHELMMLGAKEGDRDALSFWLRFGGLEALQSYAPKGESPTTELTEHIPPKHWHFIEHMCDYKNKYETKTHIFVHANLHPGRSLDEQTSEHLHWETLSPRTHRPHMSGKVMICGHTEQRSGIPLVLEKAICIDTWVYGNGWLTCLDVDSGRYWQANELGATRQGMIEMR
jgi:serine/threonine protein phosphatase 1